MIKKLKKIICLSICWVFIFPVLPILAADTSASAFLSTGSQNNILSNDSFVDIGSMDVAAIQAFLVSNNSYLKDYTDPSAIGANRSAAQIIYDAAHGLYDAAVGTAKGISITAQTGTISPRVILVFLQKEQSLVSKTARDDTALDRAMGYMCPDESGCDPTYAGFAMQVGWGAWQLRYNHEASKNGVDWWNEKYGAGNPSICYVGQTKTFVDYTGSYDVTLSNSATASIYRYTPHVFDSAYNVWQLYNTYTWPAPPSGGDPPPPPPPPPPPRKAGDVNSDNAIDSTDLSVLADQWGKNVSANTGGDFNGDGIVDSTDLSILADAWGK